MLCKIKVVPVIVIVLRLCCALWKTPAHNLIWTTSNVEHHDPPDPPGHVECFIGKAIPSLLDVCDSVNIQKIRWFSWSTGHLFSKGGWRKWQMKAQLIKKNSPAPLLDMLYLCETAFGRHLRSTCWPVAVPLKPFLSQATRCTKKQH